jgi:single-strand DNA-binding protein
MPNLNKVMLIGNVTRDPEVKYTPKGTAVAEVGLAINRIYTPEGGERREETTFVDITFWGRQAEIVGQYAKKGSPLYVEGRLQLDSWEDKQSGQKRSKLRVVGEQLQLLGSRSGGAPAGGDYEGGGEASSAPRPPQRTASPPQRPASEPPEEDDIPF